MDLKVLYEEPSAAAPSCYVSLPPAVVLSLIHERGVHFFVLRVDEHLASGVGRCLFLGWDGGSARYDGRLGIGSGFAGCIGLENGKRVEVHAVEHASAPSSSSVCLATESDEDYRIISTTAEFVEGALLQQIRVLYPGLVFPLRLPGRVTVKLVVQNISVPEQEADFIVIDPSVEVSVTPPGSRAEDRGEAELPQSSSSWQPSGTFRAVPMPSALLPTNSQHVIVRHTQDTALTGSRACEERAANAQIWKKSPVFAGSPSVPVMVVSRADTTVAESHVLVPPYVWWELGLSLLSPVVLQPVSREDVPDSIWSVTIARLPRFDAGAVGSLDEKAVVEYIESLQKPFVAYSGMPLRKGDLVVVGHLDSIDDAARERILRRSREKLLPVEEYDASFSEAKTDNLSQPRGEVESQNISKRAGTAQIPPICHPSWVVGKDTRVKLSISARANLYDNKSICPPEAIMQEWPPCAARSSLPFFGSLRGATHRKLARRILVHIGHSLAASTLEGSHVEPAPRFVVLRGEQGSGKTLMARTVSRLMLQTRSYRTVWIRWRVHADETLETGLTRVRKAFSDAHESRPAVIVFDDYDATSSASMIAKRHEEEGLGHAHKANAFVLAQAVAALCTQHDGVHVLLTCGLEFELSEELLRPGVITFSTEIGVPSCEDRVNILSELVARIANSLGVSEATDKTLKSVIAHVSRATEGFLPGDLERAVEQACVGYFRTKEERVPFSDILVDVSSNFLPRSKIGALAKPRDVSHSWDSVGGMWHAKSTLKEMLELPSRYPDVFSNSPVRLPRGVLLYGPPGCGKTMLALAVAGSCGIESIPIKGPELLSKYVGESEAEVRRVFQRASTLAPCVIVFDEFDALAPRRGGETTGVADRVVNTLLTCLDGVERLAEGVSIVATTSHPELIDPAVLRPGRIDRLVPIHFPSVEERIDIFRCLWRTLPVHASVADDVGLQSAAEATPNMSGADLRGIARDAQILAEEAASGSHEEPLIDLDCVLRACSCARSSVSDSQRRAYASVMSHFGRLDTAAAGGALTGKAPVKVALG